MFTALGVEGGVSHWVSSFCESEDYDKMLAHLVKVNHFNNYESKPSALTNRLIVAWDPDQAHVWLTKVVAEFCKPAIRVEFGLYRGTLLGLLEAGVKLDKEYVATEFQSTLLMQLMKVVCHNTVPDPRDMTHPSFGGGDKEHGALEKRLKIALKTFLAPNHGRPIRAPQPGQPVSGPSGDPRVRRAAELKAALAYLTEHVRPQPNNRFDQQVIEIMVGTLMSRRTANEKLVALQHMLESDPVPEPVVIPPASTTEPPSEPVTGDDSEFQLELSSDDDDD